MESPKCPYCGDAQYLTIEDHSELGRMVYYLCLHCGSRSPAKTTIEEAYAAAMKRENKYREQVENDVKAALKELNDSSHRMPYHIYSMLFDQISAIGYTPSKRGAEMEGQHE